MKRKIFYFENAKSDIRQSKLWYCQQSSGLDKKFAAEIKKTIISLAELPVLHAIRYRNIRIAHPAIFPYGKHYYYLEDSSEIVIIAIIHNSRYNDEIDY